jgi:indole-3-glycerol phosphate synthase
MNILKKITNNTRIVVEERKKLYPIAALEESMYMTRGVFSLKNNLQKGSFGIISEFKKQSPSKGVIHKDADVEAIVSKYAEAGVVGCSVLTDENFFGGSNADLVRARQKVDIPILRKDFIIDEYQLYEAKALGADVILLIAECLEKNEVAELATKAKKLGLEVLMEIHSEKQLDKLHECIDIVGVNNRDLETFSVSIQTSLDLFDKIPDDFVKISESGISNARSVVRLIEVGFQGFLIGENFMKTEDPGLACKGFIDEVDSLLKITRDTV